MSTFGMSVTFNSVRGGSNCNSTMSSTTAVAIGKVSKQRNQLIGLCHDVSGKPLRCKCAVKCLCVIFIIHAI